MAFIGDTVRLIVRFKTYSGSPVDPTDVKLKVLDGEDYSNLLSINVPEENKTDIGVYEYDYTIPSLTSDRLIYEYSGIYDGKPILTRGSFSISFV